MAETKDKIRLPFMSRYDEEISAFYKGESSGSYGFLGCHYIDGISAHLFAVWAPNAVRVSVVGDFNEWDESANPMEQYRGIWYCTIEGLCDGDNYKYHIGGADGKPALKADPYAFHAERAPGTASKVWSLDGYCWRDQAWLNCRAETDILKSPVSIYEMHMGSWRIPEGYEYPSFRETADELAVYLKETGYTHVELMPVNEYPFDGSWGYQVTGFFAITSRFGTPQDFMYFVDTMHRAKIGVIVDWVPSGFPKDAHGPAHFDGTWLYEHANPIRRTHPHWGTNSFNYARPEVVSFLLSSATLLADKYHLDGIRVDAVSSILYLDYGRDEFVPNKDGGNIDLEAVAFLKKVNSSVLSAYPGTFTVAEESTAFPLVTKPPHDGGLGFMFKWNMGFMNDTLDYMKTDPYFRHGNHDKMTFSMHYAFSENYILAYSHDEVVHGKASLVNKMNGDYDGKFASLRLLYAWQYAHPGKKLMFMGDEFAQFIEWNYKQELDWLLLGYGRHSEMKEWVAALNRSYVKRKALHAADGGWDGFTWLNVEDRSNSVFAFMRTYMCGEARAEIADADTGTDSPVGAVSVAAKNARPTPGAATEQMVCVFNFTPVHREKYRVAMPAPGTLSIALNSDDEAFGGTGARIVKKVTSGKIALNGFDDSAQLSLPPLSALYYVYKSK